MKRCAAALVALVLTPGCKARVCEPWKPLDLPGITSIDRCYDSHIGGETTASADDFVRALEAKGFTAGRALDGTIANQRSWITFVKSGDPSMYRMPAGFGVAKGKSGTDHFFLETTTKDERWIPEATWKRLPTIDMDRKALTAKLAAAVQLFADAKGAPERCDDAVLAREPALVAKKASLLARSDSLGLAGWPAEPRSYLTPATPAPGAAKSAADLDSTDVASLARDRAELDELSGARLWPILRVTSYEAPKMKGISPGARILGFGTFTGGRATLDVGVVDLVEHRVLCRAKTEARSSDEIKVSQTDSGSVLGSPGDADLADNIDHAARASLGRMSALLK
jgi:hypothetical protein